MLASKLLATLEVGPNAAAKRLVGRLIVVLETR